MKIGKTLLHGKRKNPAGFLLDEEVLEEWLKNVKNKLQESVHDFSVMVYL
jgi:hypothetical protein